MPCCSICTTASARSVVIVALCAFEMGVEFEIVDVVFAMSCGETHHQLALAHQPQQAERDLAVVGGDDLDAPARRARSTAEL